MIHNLMEMIVKLVLGVIFVAIVLEIVMFIMALSPVWAVIVISLGGWTYFKSRPRKGP